VTDGLEVERNQAEPADDDIDKEIEHQRQQNAELRTPEPMRPATKGDVLTVDYSVSIDGEERPEMAAQDRDIEVGSERLLPELVTGLVGLRPEDTKDIQVQFGDDLSREDLRGKQATFHVKVKNLREKILPELDDEFAKDCGDYESLEDLRQSVRERLRKAAAQQAEARVREQLIEKLVDKNDVPVPPSLVERQAQAMLQEYSTFQQILGSTEPIDEDTKADLQVRAERKVKAALLFGELARQAEIKVEKDDLEAKFKEIAEQTGKHIAKVRADFQGERRETLETQILENKLLEYLLARATIKEKAD
jgi:trigger factor